MRGMTDAATRIVPSKAVPVLSWRLLQQVMGEYVRCKLYVAYALIIVIC